MSSLEPLAPDLWVARAPLRFFGAEVGTRMTVVRLPDGGLFLCSPMRPDPALFDAIDALGPVRALIAPNRWHHLFVGDWQRRYPEARSLAAPGLPEKRPDLRFDGVLDDEPEAPWAGVIDQTLWRGAPMMNEIVFCHRPSGTLVLTDAMNNLGADTPLSAKILFGLLGGGKGPRATLIERIVNRDRKAARASLDRILGWGFDRVIVAHGEVLEGGGHAALEGAYRWLR